MQRPSRPGNSSLFGALVYRGLGSWYAMDTSLSPPSKPTPLQVCVGPSSKLHTPWSSKIRRTACHGPEDASLEVECYHIHGLRIALVTHYINVLLTTTSLSTSFDIIISKCSSGPMHQRSRSPTGPLTDPDLDLDPGPRISGSDLAWATMAADASRLHSEPTFITSTHYHS
jgi:hypothetical protein